MSKKATLPSVFIRKAYNGDNTIKTFLPYLFLIMIFSFASWLSTQKTTAPYYLSRSIASSDCESMVSEIINPREFKIVSTDKIQHEKVYRLKIPFGTKYFHLVTLKILTTTSILNGSKFIEMLIPIYQM